MTDVTERGPSYAKPETQDWELLRRFPFCAISMHVRQKFWEFSLLKHGYMTRRQALLEDFSISS